MDQWDWEKVIAPRDRNVDYLKATVRAIVSAMADTQNTLRSVFPQLSVLPQMEREVSFVTTQELEDLLARRSPPRSGRTPGSRSTPPPSSCGIGGALKSGKPHDGRAPDYDDWTLNGDILFWDAVLDRAIELSSMGIRVDAAGPGPPADRRRLRRPARQLPFHKMLLDGELPLTIGGGIGQSRLSMLLLGKAHIGEVQASVWDDETIDACQDAGIILL